MRKAELEGGFPARPPGGLAGQIRGEIEAAGAISFARFMALALYAPGLGYYEREAASIGRQGDFYTSVSVGCLFGELLAFQFARWAAANPDPAGSLQLVEAGAHDGRLAADVLGWLHRERPKLWATLDYWIVEPSQGRRQWQQQTLAEFNPQVRWSPDLSDVPRSACQVLFCNELLDAFPVRRLGWDARGQTWFEWGVGSEGGRFVWKRMALGFPTPSSPEPGPGRDRSPSGPPGGGRLGGASLPIAGSWPQCAVAEPWELPKGGDAAAGKECLQPPPTRPNSRLLKSRVQPGSCRTQASCPIRA